LINVTIVYPSNNITIWDFVCGRVKKIVVNIEVMPVTAEILGDYENDREFRAKFQSYLNQLWNKKDNLIKTILLEEK
jgi:hypothetical protein